LTYYQALLLLGIPEDEREKFILQHDVEDMTIRELDQALKERNQTAPEKEQAQVTPLPNNPQDIKLEYLTVKKIDKPRSSPKASYYKYSVIYQLSVCNTHNQLESATC